MGAARPSKRILEGAFATGQPENRRLMMKGWSRPDMERAGSTRGAFAGRDVIFMNGLFRFMPPFLRDPPMRRKIVHFALIGVGNTLVDFSVFTIAYKVFGLPIVASNVVAWMVAVSCSYVLNTFITFRVESGRRLRFRDYMTFAASGVLGMVMTTAVLLLLSLYLHVLLAKAVSILVGFAVNFTMSNLVVFRTRRPKA